MNIMNTDGHRKYYDVRASTTRQKSQCNTVGHVHAKHASSERCNNLGHIEVHAYWEHAGVSVDNAPDWTPQNIWSTQTFRTFRTLIWRRSGESAQGFTLQQHHVHAQRTRRFGQHQAKADHLLRLSTKFTRTSRTPPNAGQLRQSCVRVLLESFSVCPDKNLRRQTWAIISVIRF